MNVVLLAAAAAVVLPRTATPAGFAGRFIAYAERLYQCGREESQHKLALYVTNTRFDKSRPYELQRVSGNLTHHFDPRKVKNVLDDSNWLRVRLDSRSNSEWKLNAFNMNFPGGACSVAAEHLPSFARIVFGEAIMSRKPCVVPLPSEALTFVDQPVNWTFPKFPVMPYGYFRFHLTVGRAEDVFGCANVDAHSIPRPKH